MYEQNPIFAYELHILNNKYHYGTATETLHLLKPRHKGTRIDGWETFYMRTFHKHKILTFWRRDYFFNFSTLCI